MRKALLAIAIAQFLLLPSVSAQIPRLIGYQGVVHDPSGALVSDGPHTFRFKIYSEANGGTELFAETQNITVARGTFSSMLGAASGGLPALLTFDIPYFLGVSIDGSAELQPRTPILPVAYAFIAQRALIADSIAPGLIPSTMPPSGPAAGDLSGEYPSPVIARLQGQPLSAGNPSPGQVLQFNGGNWVAASIDGSPWAAFNSNISNTNTGNVGIGTTAPSTRLEVNGTTRTKDLQITTGASSGKTLISNASGIASWTNDVRIVSGNVGIGDTTPKAKLHVAAGNSGFDPTFTRSMVIEEDGALTLSLRGPTQMEQSILFERPVGDTGLRISSQPDGDMRIGRYRFSDNGSASTSFYIFLDTKTGNVGIKRDPTTNDLEVDGSASKLTAGDWLANSDRRIKQNIQDIEGSMTKIMRLRPVMFRYSDQWLKRNPSIKDRFYYNFIAQEYGDVFPDAVQSSGEFLENDAEPILQIDTYDAQIVTIKAVQDLIRENEAIKQDNRKLHMLIEDLSTQIDAVHQALRELRSASRTASKQ